MSCVFLVLTSLWFFAIGLVFGNLYACWRFEEMMEETEDE